MAPITPFAMSATPSVGVFFSPPEPSKPNSFTGADSPHQQASTTMIGFDDSLTLPPILSLLPSHSHSHSPLSPPISPLDADFKRPHGPSHPSRPSRLSGIDTDYELFPRKRSAATAGQTSPLFRPLEPKLPLNPPDPTCLHARSAPLSLSPSSPEQKECMSTVTIKSSVLDKYMVDPVGWFRQEQEYLKAYSPRFPQRQQLQVTTTGNNTIGSKRIASLDTDRPAKRSRPALKSLTEKLYVSSLTPKKRSVRSPPRSELDGSLPQHAVQGTQSTRSTQTTQTIQTSQPVVKYRRKVSQAPSTPREQMDYHTIHDYSPSISTIPAGKKLTIDWKGHPLDLSNDPDRHKLDDAEIQLSSVLRLTAAQYLFAKRKIFERFVELTRIGKDFNKTSAQGVCKIDVNKASKLWTAFDKVGWFDRRLFSQYLQ